MSIDAAALLLFALSAVLFAVMCRGLIPLAYRMRGIPVWRLTLAGFGVLLPAGRHDVLRELAVMPLPVGNLALGSAVFQVGAFAVPVVHYSGTLEDRQRQGLQLRRPSDAGPRDPRSGLFTRAYLEDMLNRPGVNAHDGLLLTDLDRFKAIDEPMARPRATRSSGPWRSVSAATCPTPISPAAGLAMSSWSTCSAPMRRPCEILADRLGQALRADRVAPVAQRHDGDWHTTVGRADLGMCRAKRTGRDRLVFAADSPV